MIKGSPVSFSPLINMPNIKGANIVSLEDSEKNGNPWKIIFYPKRIFFRISDIFYFSHNSDLPQIQSCKFHFLRGKRHTDMPRKKTIGQPFKRLKFITKTCLYNFDPLKPHFHTVNWGLEGYTIFFLISAQTIDCGYSLEPPRRGGSNGYPQWFEQKYEKYQSFLKIFIFWRWNCLYIWIGVFS